MRELTDGPTLPITPRLTWGCTILVARIIIAYLRPNDLLQKFRADEDSMNFFKEPDRDGHRPDQPYGHG